VAEDALNVAVNTPVPQKSSLSIRERLFGNKATPASPVKKTAKKRSNKKLSLIQGAMPTMLSALLVTFVRDRLPEEYRPCAPTRAEATAMLTPIFDELARYVEITGKVSETVINLGNSLIAIVAYSARSYCTYIEIKHDLAKGKRHDTERQSKGFPADYYQNLDDGGNYTGGYRGNQEAVSGIDGLSPIRDESRPGIISIDRGNGAGNPDGDERSELSDADKIAAMFRQDRQGRVGLGLLAS
jgi:hypothetical protein